MPSEVMSDAFIMGLLTRLMARQRWSQVYLFGAAGEPFWAAHMPLKQWEIPLFAEALDLIEAAEAERPKPFVAHDRGGRFVVGAVDAREDLYVVLVPRDDEPASAHATVVATRIDAAREELRPFLESIRRAAGLASETPPS